MLTKNNKKGCLVTFVFIAVFIAAIVFTLHRINKSGETIQDWRDKNLKDIHFKGKVLDSKEITIEGRHYGIVCIGLDYSNKDSCYLYEPGISFLKIKNGKALMLMGSNLLDNRVDYIEVNINNSGK